MIRYSYNNKILIGGLRYGKNYRCFFQYWHKGCHSMKCYAQQPAVCSSTTTRMLSKSSSFFASFSFALFFMVWYMTMAWYLSWASCIRLSNLVATYRVLGNLEVQEHFPLFQGKFSADNENLLLFMSYKIFHLSTFWCISKINEKAIIKTNAGHFFLVKSQYFIKFWIFLFVLKLWYKFVLFKWKPGMTMYLVNI